MDRPTQLTASRIIGLDLSKKTLVGCSLSIEDGFQKKKHFNGLMNAQGRARLAAMMGKGDAVFMEGGSSSFTLARYLLSNTEADVFVLNPMQLHIIYESMCKTDKQDSAKLAKYARDTHPENWCLIPIPTEQDVSRTDNHQSPRCVFPVPHQDSQQTACSLQRAGIP